MLYEMFHEVRLWWLQLRQQRVSNAHDRKLKSLRKSKASRDLIDTAEHDAYIDHLDFEGLMDELQSRYLLRQIGKYRLAFPTNEDWAEERAPFYHRHLKREVMVKLRSSIRLEQKERWERWMRWVPVLSAITGVLGTVIGIIATLKK